MKYLDLDREAATNSFTSPPNPIPQQSSFQFLRYLRELYTYSRESRSLVLLSVWPCVYARARIIVYVDAC